MVKNDWNRLHNGPNIIVFIQFIKILIQNGQYPSYINNFYRIDRLLFIVLELNRGGFPLSTKRFDKLSVSNLVQYIRRSLGRIHADVAEKLNKQNLIFVLGYLIKQKRGKRGQIPFNNAAYIL